MPWTPREKRFLLSSGSPLTGSQKQKMLGELHSNPALGHAKKGSSQMKKASTTPMREMRIEIHRGPQQQVTGHTIHHHMMPSKASKSGAFMEETHHSFPFGPKDHAGMMKHIAGALGGAKGGAENMADEAAGEEEGEA